MLSDEGGSWSRAGLEEAFRHVPAMALKPAGGPLRAPVVVRRPEACRARGQSRQGAGVWRKLYII